MNIRLLAALSALFLVACGGGGSSGGSSQPPGIDAAPTAADQSAPPIFESIKLYNGRYATTFRPGRFVAETEQGWDASIHLAVHMEGDYGMDSEAVIWDPDNNVLGSVYLKPQGGGHYQAVLPINADLPIGPYTGYLHLKVCKDYYCQRAHEGAPWKLPYHITIKPSTIGTLAPLVASIGAPDWTMFQGNASHTGHVPLTVTKFQRRWSWSAPSGPDTLARQATVNAVSTFDGTVYLTTSLGFTFGEDPPSNHAYALSEESGQQIWHRDLGRLDNNTAPSVTAEHVFITGQSALVQLDRSTGEERQRTGFSSQWPTYMQPTVHADGVYGVTGSNGGLTKWSAATATQAWTHSWVDADNWTPAVTDQYVLAYSRYSNYCCYGGAGLSVLDPVTGNKLFAIDDPDNTDEYPDRSPHIAPVMTSPSTVVTLNGRDQWTRGKQNRLIRFDLNARKMTWQVQGRFPGNPVFANGVVYITQSWPFRLQARSEATGALLWEWTEPYKTPYAAPSVYFPTWQWLEPTPAGSMVVTDSHIIVSTASAVHAIDLATQQSVWSYPRAGELAVSARGVLYISVMAVGPSYSLSEGRVVAISLR